MSPGIKRMSMTWKISVSITAVHVYKSPKGLWDANLGVPHPTEYATKKSSLEKARQLAGRYRIRLLAE